MKLEGKIINFIGDSITEGVGVKDIENNRYDNVLKRECKLKETHNYGVSGSRIAHQIRPSDNPRQDLLFCGRAYDINPNADVIIVYGGINDFLHGDAPIGKEGDVTTATFHGAVYFLMNLLTQRYAGKTVVFLTPARCNFCGVTSEKPSTNPRKYTEGEPVKAYVDIIEKTAKQFNIPVLNLYDNLGIDPNREEDKVKYTADGLHFNDAGHKILAEKIKNFLEAL